MTPVLPAQDLAAVSPGEARALQDFEDGLNPGAPERSNVPPTIIGYGEISTTFLVPNLSGLACKRMSGFSSASEAAAYVNLVVRYTARLREIAICVAQTRTATIAAHGGPPVVYLLQPLLDAPGLGHKLLHTAPDHVLLRCIDRVLDYALALHRANTREGGATEIAVDAQLSNWHFTRESEDDIRPPTLIDVGTPFMRRNGLHELDPRFLLAPVPQPIRWYYQRQHAVEKYLDDYFDTRKLLIDLVCNFHKEGRPDRIPMVLRRMNTWMEANIEELPVKPISIAEVEQYYKQDVASLELYMRVRKLDRFIRTRILRQRYRYTLPGPVER